MEFEGGIVDGAQAAETGAEVDVGLRTQRAQFFLQAAVLLERLQESANGIERGEVHLLF
jgi:hypothetical protein